MSEEVGGEVELTDKGKPHRLHVPHRRWQLVVDIYTVSTGQTSAIYTRLRSLFVRAARFELRVTKRNPLHALGELIGYRGVKLAYGPIDRTLFVRSDRPAIAKSLLRGTSVGQALQADPPNKLLVTRPGKRIRKKAGETLGELQLLVGGKVRDPTRLASLVRLCTDALDDLERLGVAADTAVEGVAL